MTSLDADTLLQRLAALFPSCIVNVPALDAEHPAHRCVDFARLSQLVATSQLTSIHTVQTADKGDIYAENKHVVPMGGGVRLKDKSVAQSAVQNAPLHAVTGTLEQAALSAWPRAQSGALYAMRPSVYGLSWHGKQQAREQVAAQLEQGRQLQQSAVATAFTTTTTTTITNADAATSDAGHRVVSPASSLALAAPPFPQTQQGKALQSAVVAAVAPAAATTVTAAASDSASAPDVRNSAHHPSGASVPVAPSLFSVERLESLCSLQAQYAQRLQLIVLAYNQPQLAMTGSDLLKCYYQHLLACRPLLKTTGLLAVVCDVSQHHHVRLLCDEVMGERNFAAQLVWQCAPQVDLFAAPFSAESRDALADQSRSEDQSVAMAALAAPFGAEAMTAPLSSNPLSFAATDVLQGAVPTAVPLSAVNTETAAAAASLLTPAAASVWTGSRGMTCTQRYVLLYTRDHAHFVVGRLPRTAVANARYKNPDHDPRGVWHPDNLTAKSYFAKNDYPITTPSGRVVLPPAGSCWRFNPQQFAQLVAANRIYFGATGNNVPRYKRFLSELKHQGLAPSTLLVKDRGQSLSPQELLSQLCCLACITPPTALPSAASVASAATSQQVALPEVLTVSLAELSSASVPTLKQHGVVLSARSA